jgi:hypothetical protein
MARFEVSAPLLAVRQEEDPTNSVIRNANTSGTEPKEARKTTQTPQNGREEGLRPLSRFARPFNKLAAGIKASYKTATDAMQRSWKKNWTVETFSFIFSILTLAGLVVTLVAHQGKPLPDWPQLITINSVISLFSLLMRTGISVVLTEGML